MTGVLVGYADWLAVAPRETNQEHCAAAYVLHKACSWCSSIQGSVWWKFVSQIVAR